MILLEGNRSKQVKSLTRIHKLVLTHHLWEKSMSSEMDEENHRIIFAKKLRSYDYGLLRKLRIFQAR